MHSSWLPPSPITKDFDVFRVKASPFYYFIGLSKISKTTAKIADSKNYLFYPLMLLLFEQF